MTARNGDMVNAPFQCDHCWFINLNLRCPNEFFPADARLMSYIRRVNLDMFWSKEGSTVGATYRALKKARGLSEQLGLTPVRIVVGPWPLGDTVGFQIALEILRASKLPGRNDTMYTQFDSIRKIRSAYMNVLECDPSRGLDNKTLKTDKGQMLTQLNSCTQSKLFCMFMKGCEKRMGRFVKQDLGLSFEVLMEILRRFNMELALDTVNYERKRLLVVGGAAFVILWAAALRGGEVLLVEASELVKRRNDGRKDGQDDGYVVVPLMGRFKGETGERNMIIVLANKSQNGLEIRKWIDYLSALLMAENRQSKVGPAICDAKGVVCSMYALNNLFHEVLASIQDESPNIIPSDINVVERYSIYRSFRRGATTRAKEMKVPTDIIEMNNRWRKVERQQGSLPRLPMTQLYMEITQVIDTKLRFSRAL